MHVANQVLTNHYSFGALRPRFPMATSNYGFVAVTPKAAPLSRHQSLLAAVSFLAFSVVVLALL
jgi:hypothetical protein